MFASHTGFRTQPPPKCSPTVITKARQLEMVPPLWRGPEQCKWKWRDLRPLGTLLDSRRPWTGDLLPASHLPLQLLVPRIQDLEEGRGREGRVLSPPWAEMPRLPSCPLSAGARQAQCWTICADQSCFCWSRPQGGPSRWFVRYRASCAGTVHRPGRGSMDVCGTSRLVPHEGHP